MKITIYKSKYSSKKIMNILASDENGEKYAINEYHNHGEFVIKDENSYKLKIVPFVKKKEKKLIEWQNLLKQIIPNKTIDTEFENIIGFSYDAILLVTQHKVKNVNTYIISFGQAYHDISEFIDYDFGIEFAEKTIPAANVTTKNVNFIQQSRLASITNYRRANSDLARPSESYVSIGGYPVEVEKYGKYIVNCSTGITFNISAKQSEFKRQLIGYITNIDETLSSGNIINTYPRILQLKDKDIIEKLNNMMYEDIIKDTDSLIDLNNIIFSGQKIILLDNMSDLIIHKNSNKIKTKEKLSEDKKQRSMYDFIKNYIKSQHSKHGSQDIKQYTVNIVDEESIETTIPLIKLLHAQIILDEEVYLLQEGKWGGYNNEYLELINTSLDNIDLQLNHLKQLSFEGTEPKYIDKSCSENSGNVKLHEKFVKSNNKNFMIKGNGIELADIYNRERDELYAVKKGINTINAIYSIEQCILAINVLNNQKSYNLSEVENTVEAADFHKIKKTLQYGIIWMLPIKASDSTPVSDKTHTESVLNKSFKLKNLGSALLKNKLVEWSQLASENRIQGTIYMETPTDTSR